MNMKVVTSIRTMKNVFFLGQIFFKVHIVIIEIFLMDFILSRPWVTGVACPQVKILYFFTTTSVAGYRRTVGKLQLSADKT